MKKGKGSRVMTILIMIAFAFAGYFATRMGIVAAREWPLSVIVGICLLFIPIFLLVIGVHEAGHVVAGLGVKFDFRMFVIGPFMWEKEWAHWRFKWNKNLNVSGGMVICLPVGSENLGKRFSAYAAGGPVASLLFTALSYGLYRLLAFIHPTGAGMLLAMAIFGLMTFLSALIFLATIIPIHSNGFSSDGARILRLSRKGDASRFEVLLLKIISESSAGIRPGLLEMPLLEEAQRLATKLNAPMGIYLNGYFHQAAFDHGDIENAEKYLEAYIQTANEIPEGIRGAVWLDAAFFYAYAKKDLTRASAYWEKFKPSAILPKAQVFAAEAAICVLKNENKSALLKIQSALMDQPNMIDKGVGVALRDRLLALQKHCLATENQLAASPRQPD